MHLPRTQTALIDGQPPIIFQRPYSWKNEEGGWGVGRSHAYVCPVCLRVWAKLPMEGIATFNIHSVPCTQHISGEELPGSLIPRCWVKWPGAADEGLLQYLPLPLLERELFIYLTYHERLRND